MIQTFIAAAMIAATIFAHDAGIVINVTPSVARGLWQQTDQPLARDVMVIACPPATDALKLGADRQYLSDGDCPTRYEPLIKPIAAMPGDTVVVRPDGVIAVNGAPLKDSRGLDHDDDGRPLTAWPVGTYIVAPGEVWLVSTYSPRSFDSRYLGPVPISSIRGAVKPLWTVQ